MERTCIIPFTYGDAVFISLNSEDPDGDTNTNGY
jgi:hypothetical protein